MRSKEYYEYITRESQKTLTLSRIISPIAACVIALFLYQDIYILQFYFTLPFRLIAITFFLLYFLLSLTILPKYISFVIPCYTITLTSGVFMILGIAYHFFSNPFPDSYISNVSAGIQTVLIVLFLIASGALRYVPFITLLPLIAFIVLLLIHNQLSIHEATSLSNPITTAFFVSLLSYLIERRNFNEFILNNRIEKNEEILNRYKFTIERDLEFASQLHRHIMPQNPPSPNIAVLYRAYYNLGGDFYDFITLDKNACRVGIFISDVSGHGISAAFITALLKHYLIIGKKYYQNPHKLLYYLNEYITDVIGSNFVTALYCIVDFEKKEFIYSNASHYLPIIAKRDGSISELPKIGKPYPLGITKKREMAKRGKYFQVAKIKLQKGDKIILYTDGIIELYDSTTHQIENSQILHQTVRQYFSLPPKELLQKLEQMIFHTITPENIQDDVCIIIIEI